MILADFIFLSLNMQSFLSLYLLTTLVLALFASRATTNFLVLSYLFFSLVVCQLILNGLELFGSIIFLSETLVFFYIFLINLIRSTTLIFAYKKFYLYVAFLILVLSFPCYSSFYNYSLIDWYFSLSAVDNDVFGIYYYFYYHNWVSLLFIGLLLVTCTYFICIVTIYIHSNYNARKNKRSLSKDFFQKSQTKSYQSAKKPYMFYRFLFNDK